jgi:murein DD-endopeptidase MepM/ murein hydrolase activator NlpD
MIARIPLVILMVGISACSVSSTVGTPPQQASTTTSNTAGVPVPCTTQPTTTAAPSVSSNAESESPCLARANFGDPADSDYILPYPAGGKYYVSQSYCSRDGSHSNQLAYDFDMPIGTEVLAARGGTVKSIRDDSPDDGEGYGEHNYVFIQHTDGTVAFYAHLMQDGVLVEPGDEVAAGDLIAFSGNSGLTGGRPHLHFGVYLDWPPHEGRDAAVNFRNASGQLDPRGGLTVWRLFEALPSG